MKRDFFSLLLLVLVLFTSSVIVRPQGPSFTVAGIKPYDQAVPGQVLDVLIEGIGSGATPVGFFVRTTRQIIGRAQIRVLNPLRGEQTGLSAPVPLEIVDEVLPPELTAVRESTDEDLARMKEIYESQKQAGKEFPSYDPNRRYLTVSVRGIDYNPKFVRVTLEQADQKFTLSLGDFLFYAIDSLVIRVPEGVQDGKVKLTIENTDGERFSTPVMKAFVLSPR